MRQDKSDHLTKEMVDRAVKSITCTCRQGWRTDPMSRNLTCPVHCKPQEKEGGDTRPPVLDKGEYLGD